MLLSLTEWRDLSFKGSVDEEKSENWVLRTLYIPLNKIVSAPTPADFARLVWKTFFQDN